MLAPDDLVLRHAWLFQESNPILPLPHGDFDRIDASLAESRTLAVIEIIAREGTLGIQRLVRTVAEPFHVGIAAANANADERAMLAILETDEERLYLCAMGYASQRH